MKWTLAVKWDPEAGSWTNVTVRPRWFPWCTDNTTLGGSTIFARHASALVAALWKPGDSLENLEAKATFRHELSHVLDAKRHGRLWVLVTHREESERNAQAAESAEWPKFYLASGNG